MADFLKPQTPIKYKKDGFYIYPLTTADQVLLEDNTRLNAALNDINSKIDNMDFGDINIEGLDDMVQINLDGATEGGANTINADTLGGKTEDMLSVAKAVDADTLGGKASSYYALVTKLTPRNLLVNSDFMNPVNRGGQTEYAVNGYTIDRWRTGSDQLAVEIVSGGIKLTNNGTGRVVLSQIIKIPGLIGKKLTFAAEFTDGSKISGCATVPTTVGTGATTIVKWITTNNSYLAFYNADGYPCARIGIAVGESYTIKNVAVYEGEYTADTLPKYQPKGYETELLICQQYNPDNGAYVGLPSIANGFDINAEGYVADARTVKTLNDNKVEKSSVVNNLTTTASGYVADARALKTLDEKFNMVKLWQNASPDSSFVSQNITIDVTGYNLLVIRYKLNASYTLYDTAICVKGQRGWMSTVMGSGGESGNYALAAWRQWAANSNGLIVFYTAHRKSNNSHAQEEANDWVIPYAIYGIKGGLV